MPCALHVCGNGMHHTTLTSNAGIAHIVVCDGMCLVQWIMRNCMDTHMIEMPSGLLDWDSSLIGYQDCVRVRESAHRELA